MLRGLLPAGRRAQFVGHVREWIATRPVLCAPLARVHFPERFRDVRREEGLAIDAEARMVLDDDALDLLTAEDALEFEQFTDVRRVAQWPFPEERYHFQAELPALLHN